MESEREIELGGDGLNGDDHYYWYLLSAIKAAREDRVLKVREEQSWRRNRRVRERHVSNTS